MASALIESKDFGGFLGKNYQSALDRSIQEFLDSPCDPNSEKFQSLSSNFQELLRCKLNPPLETIWFCSALDFRSSGSRKTDRPSERLESIKDLFQLIVTRSLSSNSWRSIVLIAPVIYELFRFISDLNNSLELKSKKQKKLLEEVKDFAGSILGYVNICSEGLAGNFDAMEGLIKPVVDLVDAWIGNVRESRAGLRQFFPLLSDSSVEWINAGELQLTELAGLVIAEAFLLKVCFDLNECGSRKEVKSEMRSWISCSITALRNPFFHGTLLMMLLEPSLPTASLLSSENEMFLKELLYDAMILVDYSFLNPKQMAQLPSMCARSISMARLMVTSEAIQMYRKNGNHKKAVSYSRAFSGSTLPSQIIKMVREEGITSEPNGSSPAALLKWILSIENFGARLFDENISKLCAKLAIDEEDADEDAKRTVEPDAEEEDVFYIDTKGEEDNGSGGHDEDDEEMKESVSAAFLAAAQSMHSSEHKRKRRGSDAKKGKFLKKPNLCDELKTVLQKDGPESDVEGSSSSSDDDGDD